MCRHAILRATFCICRVFGYWAALHRIGRAVAGLQTRCGDPGQQPRRGVGADGGDVLQPRRLPVRVAVLPHGLLGRAGRRSGGPQQLQQGQSLAGPTGPTITERRNTHVRVYAVGRIRASRQGSTMSHAPRAAIPVQHELLTIRHHHSFVIPMTMAEWSARTTTPRLLVPRRALGRWPPWRVLLPSRLSARLPVPGRSRDGMRGVGGGLPPGGILTDFQPAGRVRHKGRSEGASDSNGQSGPFWAGATRRAGNPPPPKFDRWRHFESFSGKNVSKLPESFGAKHQKQKILRFSTVSVGGSPVLLVDQPWGGGALQNVVPAHCRPAGRVGFGSHPGPIFP